MSEINPETKKYIAELLGTFILVFAACGSAIIAGSAIGNLGVSLAFGLVVLAMIYTIGSISGCHINPAVTISMLAVGKMNLKDSVFYILFQCIGATLGAGVLYLIALDRLSANATVTHLAQNGYGSAIGGYSLIVAALAEIICTFLFILVIHGSLSKNAPKGFAGISIGLTLTLVHLVLIPITNASVNPARSLGPALFVGGAALEQLWLFWLAPIIGGLLAAAVWKFLEDTKPQKPTPTARTPTPTQWTNKQNTPTKIQEPEPVTETPTEPTIETDN